MLTSKFIFYFGQVTSAQVPSSYGDGTIDLKRIYGAVYFISDDDKAKLLE